MNAIRLRRMILDAAEHVPFYRRHWAQAGVDMTRIASAVHLEFLPVVTKADLIACPPQERLDRRYLRETLHAAPTSDEARAPFSVPLDAQSQRRRRKRFLRALFDVGYTPGERVMLVTRPPHPIGAAFLRWSYVDPGTGDDAVFKRYGKVRPHVLHAPLRTLVLLARRLLAAPQVTWRPRLLVSTGEPLSDAMRALLEASFGAKIADFYCTAEMGLIAYTKPWSTGYELLKDEFHFELLPAPGARDGLHRLVVTDLVPGSTPLIRFDTGDVVSAIGCTAPAHVRAVAPAPSHAAARATILAIGSPEPEPFALSDGTWLSPEEVARALERRADALQAVEAGQAAGLGDEGGDLAGDVARGAARDVAREVAREIAREAARDTSREGALRGLPVPDLSPRDLAACIDRTVAAGAAR